MNLSIIKLKAKLQKKPASKQASWVWFFGLYFVALLFILLVSCVIHALVALLIIL